MSKFAWLKILFHYIKEYTASFYLVGKVLRVITAYPFHLLAPSMLLNHMKTLFSFPSNFMFANISTKELVKILANIKLEEDLANKL